MSVVIEKAPVKSDKAVVGHAEFPVFDDKNPAIGLQDIMSFDWKAAGYLGAEDAIVRLVNTQHATNIKNAIRAKANPKLTGEVLSKRVTIEFAKFCQGLQGAELTAFYGDPAALEAKMDEIKKRLIAEHEAASAAARAAVASEGDEE